MCAYELNLPDDMPTRAEFEELTRRVKQRNREHLLLIRSQLRAQLDEVESALEELGDDSN